MDASESVGPAHKSWWGPRIWRVLHMLAEIGAERTDTGAGWRAVIRTTMAMLPCAVCREHFGVAARGWSVPSGVRHGLWAAHAAVGGVLSEAELAGVYGNGGCDAAAAIVSEVGREFRRVNVLDRFRVGYLAEWECAVGGLIRLLRLPPTTSALRADSHLTTSALRADRRGGPSGANPAVSRASLRGHPTLRGRRYA